MLLLFNHQLGFAGGAVPDTAKKPEKRVSGHAITGEFRASERRRLIEADDEEIMMMAATIVAMLGGRL